MNASRTTGAAWAFAQVDDFWARYQPLTPWGKDEAEARAVLTDRAAIEGRYDDIDAALGFIGARRDDPSSIDRVSYHLKRMPRMTLEVKDSYELLELFQIKKFMANYRGLVSALGADVIGVFGLTPLSPGTAGHALASELDRGGSDPETFYVADSYDEGLAAARAVIAAADAAIARERIKAEAEARLTFGLSFDGREFLVVSKDTVRAMAESGGRYSIDPFDDSRYVVRLMPSSSAVEAMADRERGLEDERRAEARVVARISVLAAAAMPELEAAVAAVARWDRARAGAALALELGMTRPRLDSDRTSLASARFVPCADECARMGLAYSPLSADFGADAVVLFGSNMGGKTVVLKTVIFFQLLAQAGLFVPAERYETSVYGRVEYVGELSGERLAGLSGFGLEVWRLIAANSGLSAGTGRARGTRSLVAFDELARTTGSHEAEALLSAVVEAYASGTGDRAFFATHFRGVARIRGAEYRRMRGLDKSAAEAALNGRAGAGSGDSGQALAERLAGINRYMRYEVVDDDGSGSESDALAIASFLGLDGRVVDRARYFLTKDGV